MSSSFRCLRVVRWAWRNSALLHETWTLARRYGLPQYVFWFEGGLGDHLLCTAIARELRKRLASRIWMMTPYAELFEYNADFDLVLPDDRQLLAPSRVLRARVTEPRYAPDARGEDRQQSPGCHIIAKMCELAGIRGEIALRPYLNLTDTEVANGRLFPRQVAIQSSNAGGRWPTLTKQWYSERFQMVVEHLKGIFDFVQLGTSYDPPLAGALDLRDKTSPRQSAAILANSLLFVGLEGFLMHLARSVETRSVIVYGGRVLPSEIGYTPNENLYIPLPCSPCWKYNSCEYDRECMKRVAVEQVVEAVRRQAAKAGEILAVDKAVIS